MYRCTERIHARVQSAFEWQIIYKYRLKIKIRFASGKSYSTFWYRTTSLALLLDRERLLKISIR